VIELLGPWNDETWANQNALSIAQAESESLIGIDQYFAWFNRGASHVNLLQYVDAASAFDFAFQLYADLGGDNTSRPYRIMWYRTEPYKAYYYNERYQDVINLANTTLQTVSEPTLEESLYWRGLAYQALGQLGNAEADLRETIRLNPNFAPGYAALEGMGLIP
jgi:tetratricopeptide (TPR) repeat protein